MAKPITFEVKILGVDSKALQGLSVEVSRIDAGLQSVAESAQRAAGKLQETVNRSILLATANQGLSKLKNEIDKLASPVDSFESSMARVNTMAGKGTGDIKLLGKEVVELSKKVPMAREALAEGLYQAISAGVPEDNWIDYLNKSARSAVGGYADLGGTVKVTSAIIKAYGMEWSRAGEIQDKIQTTAKNGVTSFEELSQALPRVIGNAASLGVTLDELMAVFATTTNVTGNTSEVSTQLAAVLNSLVKPTSEATKAAQSMGISFDAAGVRAAGGLENFLLGLDVAVTEYSQKTGVLKDTIYGQLFGSAEALRLLGSLTGSQREKFSQNISAMADSVGAIDEAFDMVSNTAEAQAQIMANSNQSWLDHAGAVASSVKPMLDYAASIGGTIFALSQVFAGIAALKGVMVAITTSVKSGAVALAVWSGNAVRVAVATAMMNGKLAILKMQAAATAAQSFIASAATGAWTAAQAALNAVMALNPIALVVIAIGALVGALIPVFVMRYPNHDLPSRLPVDIAPAAVDPYVRLSLRA